MATKSRQVNEVLLEAITDTGLSVEEFAAKAGLSAKTVYRAINGEQVYKNTAAKIGRALKKRASSLGLL